MLTGGFDVGQTWGPLRSVYILGSKACGISIFSARMATMYSTLVRRWVGRGCSILTALLGGFQVGIAMLGFK